MPNGFVVRLSFQERVSTSKGGLGATWETSWVCVTVTDTRWQHLSTFLVTLFQSPEILAGRSAEAATAARLRPQDRFVVRGRFVRVPAAFWLENLCSHAW